MERYKGLADYLLFITENYGLEICINDFVGFMSVDRQLSSVLQPYLIHKTPFCMQIKSNRKLWDRCLQMKRGILLKSEKLKQPYYGMCYCGIEEYIVPILCNNITIGVICLGEFRTNNRISNYRIKKISREYGMDFNDLIDKLEYSTMDKKTDMRLITNLIGIIVDYISEIYTAFGSTHKTISIKDKKSYSNEAYILSHAVEYIKQNYKNRITASDVCSFCHCSESYLSHIFKKSMKLNIKAYINRVRIEESKELLINSDASVSEVALLIGFNDSNYFSNVFKEVTGITPTSFRKRFGLVQ